ncbi:MAG: carbamoyltransferase HypF [Thermoguttaceae bacterium]|jgi:hydrogenase maturation protein HypF|nr:carbamoyltransferase HypF [Thermoguttaceae bacterium]
MKPHTESEPAPRRVAVTVRGVVQGVGFRPFVYNAARAAGLAGFVRNEAGRVCVEVEGPDAALDGFVHRLRNHPPPQARIEAIDVTEIPCLNGRPGDFCIETSDGTARPQPTIPADLATCAECLAEIRNPSERRYRYPFTNCTQCGPRWSIIEGLPYDRPRTSMKTFTMCPDCRHEYENPADRRFHAQPIACPRCGPRLRLLTSAGGTRATGDDAMLAAAEEIAAGHIVALKGLGGFQLLCDATSDEAVARLRRRKRRPDRPLAVMTAMLDAVRDWCEVSDSEAETLQSPQSPILLLRRSGEPGIAESVAPGNPYLGVMLPYTPLHYLLMEAAGRPVVCTSGNLSEEPMATSTADAVRRLGRIADWLLTHNRPIVRPVDDSVARVLDGRLQILRRARGYAPQPIDLVSSNPAPILALGGHLKNTVALALLSDESPRSGRDRLRHRPVKDCPPDAPAPVPAILGSHVGDLDSVLSVEVHRRAAADLPEFFDVQPAAVACDLHPDYASTREAELLAKRWDVPLVRVQHHHAHVAACMAEHGLEGPVLGVSWDGTGYGPDGTVWGGEMLRCDRAGFARIAHLRPFPLPGGDRAVREPRRSALGLLFATFGRDAGDLALPWFAVQEVPILLDALEKGLNAPLTSSMGRLFDAVAAIAGLPPEISFEGQAAMALEFAAETAEPGAYPLPLGGQSPAVADWQPMLEAILADVRAGVPAGKVSARFHNALASLAVAAAERAGCHRVVLTGGCFQNGLLSTLARARLEEAGFEVFTHHHVPPGDGGIALGQLFVAMGLERKVPVEGDSPSEAVTVTAAIDDTKHQRE